MNIRKGVLIAAAMLLVGLCFADDSKRREPPKKLLPLLDSPTDFILHITEGTDDRATHMCDLIEALAQIGETNRAHMLCQTALVAVDEARIRSYAVNPSGDLSHLKPLGRTAAVLAKTGDAQQACVISNKIQPSYTDGNWEQIEALRLIGDGLLQAGNGKEARHTWQRALVMVNQITSPLDQVAASRNPADPDNLFIAGMRMESKASHLTRIAESLAKAGETKQALELCQQALGITRLYAKLPTKYFVYQALRKLWLLSDIVRALELAGDSKQAQGIYREIAGEFGKIDVVGPDEHVFFHVKLEIICQIAEWRKKSGQAHLTDEVFRSALNGANKISMPWNKVEALCSIARALVRTGDAKQAQEVCKQAIRVVGQMEASDQKSREVDLYNKTNAMLSVAKESLNAGDMKETRQICKMALSAVKKMEKKEYKTKLLSLIGKALAIQDGKIKKAFDADDKPMVEDILSLLPSR
ncbi:MAG: tetratricopeptide repeat protein [Verrucomicrobia bacterium]|nr:tetratricopeptide repeat protein [Verrucomicrobiota bacterium]